VPVPVSIMMTPGASDTSDDAARFGSGSAVSISRVTVCATFEVWLSTSGTVASTETVSLWRAMSSVMSMASVWLTASVTARTAGSKPSTLASTR
jgi:hypothetical protein